MALHFLVVEGNTREGREAYRSTLGKTASESYAATLVRLTPGARCDLCFPADEGANLSSAQGLEAYDGVFITGSALNVYDGGPEVERQVALARAVFAAQTPFFGSCWGLQVATAAAGGDVFRNPLGREIGMARKIVPTEAGRFHPLLAGRSDTFDAPCSHIDNVAPAPGATVLAKNAMSAVQAAEIAYDGGRFWGVQYHPEYALTEVASIIERRAAAMAKEGLAASEAEALAYAKDLRRLDAAPERADIAWRLGIDADVLDPARRQAELVNFLERWVRPHASRRGRA